jgi:hypothetical protein
MKNLFRVIVFLVIGSLFIACGPQVTATPSPVPSSATTTTSTATLTPIPSPTATATAEPTSRPEFVSPTLIPTIDPTLVPELLSKAFSIQSMEGINGYHMRQITGWDLGFGGGYWTGHCFSYHWLDTQHLLLYPATGQTGPIEGAGKINMVPQPVVINLESGSVWLPLAHESGSPLTCNRVYWSQELGMLITNEYAVPPNSNQEREVVTTYTFDGQEIAHYWGNLWNVSPSGTKILISDDTLIDLRKDQIIDFDWYRNYDHERRDRIYWSPDESRVYWCCYYYGDTNTGEGYSFEMSELQGIGAKPSADATHGYGQWVRNGDYFLIEWSVVDDGYPDFFPMFDPSAKKYYELSEMAGIPQDWTCVEANVSSDGMYVLLECWEGSYLINLETFDSRAYPDFGLDDIKWSSDGTFAWVNVFNSDLWQILSVSNKELESLSVAPTSDTPLSWHPTNNTLAYISEDTQKLELVNAQTMSVHEFALPAAFQELAWSPSGDQIGLLAEDGSLWHVDYPELKNLEQLTMPLANVSKVTWSPDGHSIAFIGGSDIYIVDVVK